MRGKDYTDREQANKGAVALQRRRRVGILSDKEETS